MISIFPPPAPRRALPVANRLRACPPAQTSCEPSLASQGRDSCAIDDLRLSAAARAYGLPAKSLPPGSRRMPTDACHWHSCPPSLLTSWATTSRDWDAAHLPQGVAAPAPLVSKLSVYTSYPALMTSKIVKSTTIDERSSGRVSRTRQACL
jgi:hypothetical protein